MPCPHDPRTISYTIDSDDRLVAVNDDFESFAHENDGSTLSTDSLLHQPLWHFIQDEETRMLYRFILGRVRSGQPITLHMRCDSPLCRRTIELQIGRQAGSQVQFDSHIVRQEARSYVALLDSQVPRTGSILSICSWCKKVQVPGHGWFEAEEAIALLHLEAEPDLPNLAHIVCFECYREVLSYLKKPFDAKPCSAVSGDVMRDA